jgi:quinolinate synthase
MEDGGGQVMAVAEHSLADEVAAIPAEIDLFGEIARLKTERKAVILAHYYQDPDIQDIADFVGDSLALAQNAKKTNAEVIVFAGVHFMAETAKMLNPERIVVVPDMAAGCSLAESCPADRFKAFIAAHPGHKVISYINCSAEVKALSDVICTSSNAEKIVRSFPPEQPLIFAPDRNLGRYIVEKLKRPMVLWSGSCIVHEIFSEKKIVELKARHPGALLVAHPECEERVLRHADFVASTAGMIKFAAQTAAKTLIVATEPGIMHAMKRAAPGKEFIHAPADDSCPCNVCPHMKLNTIEKIYLCLKNLRPRIDMDEHLRLRAQKPLLRMLELSP